VIRRGLSFLAAVLFLTWPAEVALAQGVEEIEQAWRGWMEKTRRTRGGLEVVHAGQPVREAVAGRLAPGAAVPYASLSKAITGVCVATLIERGRLSFGTPVSQALARTLTSTGSPVDPRLLHATVSELLVHRGGFGPGGGDEMARWLRRNSGGRTAFGEQLRWLFARPLQFEPGERFEYSNANYLVLGAIIEETAGQSYERYCKDAVLTPLGARDAMLDPEWRILSSYGGWRMPLEQYGRFYQAFAPGNLAIGPRARTWMMSPDGKQVGGGAHYGLGTFVRPTPRGGGNFWHAGAWSYDLADGHDGPIHASYATFAVRLGALDVNMVSFAEPRREQGDGELDGLLGAAARRVKRWP
jgi:CubicO group peptidase (beta-lactamase class C family)